MTGQTIQIGAVRAHVPQDLIRLEDKDPGWYQNQAELLNAQIPAKKPVNVPLRLSFASRATVESIPIGFGSNFDVDLAVFTDFSVYNVTDADFLENAVNPIKERIFNIPGAHAHTCFFRSEYSHYACSVFSPVKLEKQECIEIKHTSTIGEKSISNVISFSLIKLQDNSHVLVAISPFDGNIVTEIESYIQKNCPDLTISSIITVGDYWFERSSLYSPMSFANVFPLDKFPSFIDKSLFYDRNIANEKKEKALVPLQSFIHLNGYSNKNWGGSEFSEIGVNLITDFTLRGTSKIEDQDNIKEAKKHDPEHESKGTDTKLIVASSASTDYKWPFIASLCIFIPIIILLAVAYLKKGKNTEEVEEETEAEQLDPEAQTRK